MKDVFVIGQNAISSLGFSESELFDALQQGRGGLQLVDDKSISSEVLPLSRVDSAILKTKNEELGIADNFTRFEQFIIHSVSTALAKVQIDVTTEDTLMILATTKGNIDVLEPEKKNVFGAERVYLHSSAKKIQSHFSLKHVPVIISNACISGILAIINAQRLLADGTYKQVIVTGADIISNFVVAGFQSFKSLSPQPCKPFDSNRVGLSLGEGVGTLVLSNEIKSKFRVLQGASANDANHISGPSRTGEGLYNAIANVLNGAVDIDYISAHGTATPYNDDMESKAIKRAGLEHVPVNSFKGYFGHTLGAAGVIEAIAGLESMKNNVLIKTLGFENPGVAEEINIITENRNTPIKRFLKIGSGFGGCNAAVLFEKDE